MPCAGTTSGGPVSPPHPNVDLQRTFDQTYLDVVRRDAEVIASLSRELLATEAADID